MVGTRSRQPNSKPSCTQALARTVKFNIGGQRYDVSRSLLEMHPETMIAKSASKRWQQDRDSEATEIFIERDGLRFRYVLDYLRDGKVSLPVTISKEAVLKDLEYYGVDYNEENVDESAAYKAASIPSLEMAIKQLTREAVNLRKDANRLDIDARCAQLAVDCIRMYVHAICNTRNGMVAHSPIDLRYALNDRHLGKGTYNLTKLRALPLCTSDKTIQAKANIFLHKVGLTLSTFATASTYVTKNDVGEYKYNFDAAEVRVVNVKAK